ncbi:MAG: hypothetical protein LBQ98_04425 [Nitrososphaerota archaeon]|jgi:hypothetical protein|nr:hypothetical protein [Nitrososphaerota archaeon]
MITLRIDVDYPYVSRVKSFLYVALRIKSTKSESYLRNSHIIAHMINESSKQVKAYWFFTPYTIPDQRMLDLLNQEKHEVALHVATRPFEEWKTLEQKSNRKIQYYTIHGTQRLLAMLLWGRKLGQAQVAIPEDFPLKSFHERSELTMSLDRNRYLHGYEAVIGQIEDWVQHDVIISLHPDWLFRTSKKTQRGPIYDSLKTMLDVDSDLDTVTIRKSLSVRVARDFREYYKNINPTDPFLAKLQTRDVDVFTFVERKWCCPIINPPPKWIRVQDNIALLEIRDYQIWWNSIGKKTRNMVRRAEKDGVQVDIVSQSDKLAEGIWRIYNEIPVRQGRAFPHYGESRETVATNMYSEDNSTYVGAYIGGELVGFSQILHGDNIAILSNILAMQKHLDKSINNALIAKAVEVCAKRGEHWLMYGRIGNHPSLDRFKENNGFSKLNITRYYIPLTSKGKLAVKLGLHQELKDALPDAIKYPLLPAVNWVSRTKMRVNIAFKKRQSAKVDASAMGG